jgi:hypothetical protein
MTQKSALNVLLRGLLCCSLVGTSAAQVFKWVDEEGVTHYGERSPQGQKAQPVETKPITAPVPGSSPGGTQDSEYWKDKNLQFQQRRIQREQQAEREQQEAQERQRLCNVARDNLRQMESARRVYDLNEKGERVYLDEARRSTSIEQARGRVTRSCS